MAKINPKVYFLVSILIFSYLPLGSHSIKGDVDENFDDLEEQYRAGGYNPLVSTSIVDYEVVNLTNTSQPILWFKTTSLTEETYINISGFYYSWNEYIPVELYAYTSYDQCVSNWFDVRYGSTNLCSNPSEDDEIYFVLDFSDSTSPTGSRISENLSLNISIGHRVATNTAVTPSPSADGGLYADSTQYTPVESNLEPNNIASMSGNFEGLNDWDFIEFSSQYQGTHRMHASIDGPITVSPSDLDACEFDYNNGISTQYSQFSGISGLEPFKNGFVFVASQNNLDRVLWYISNFDSQPILLMNETGSQYRYASILTISGDEIYFQAYNSQSGYELWVSDGTASGTYQVADIASGSESSYPSEAIEHAGQIFFKATDWQNGQEIWATDGSQSGTYLVSDVRQGYISSNPTQLTSYSGSLFFVATNDYGYRHIWKSDGLENGVTTVFYESLNYYGTNPSFLKVHNDMLYFNANTQQEGYELWISNGTSGFASMLTNTLGYSSTSIMQMYGHPNGDLYFMARPDSSTPWGWGFWSTDGTDVGTVELTISNEALSGISKITQIDEKIYFSVIYLNNGTLDLFEMPVIGSDAEYLASLPEHSDGESHYANSQLIAHEEEIYISFESNSAHLYNLYQVNWNSYDTTTVDIYPTPGTFDWISVDGTLHISPTSSSDGLFNIDSTMANNPITTTISCDVTYENPVIQFAPVARGGYDVFNNNSELIIGWSADVSLDPIRTIEDSKTGDSMRSNIPTPLSSNGFSFGNFHNSNDVDYYVVPVKHGSMQEIEIKGKYPLSLSITGSHNCEIFTQQEVDLNSIFPYSTNVECNTIDMFDEITFSLYSNGYSYFKPENHYKISTSFQMIEPFSNYSDENGISEDIPSVGSDVVLQKGVQVEGSFFYSSDTIDQYHFEIDEGDYFKFELLSNCATIKPQKNSYAEYLFITPFLNSGSHLFVDTADAKNPTYTLEVKRLYQSSATQPHMKDRCDYKLQYDDIPVSELPSTTVTVEHDYRIGLGETIQYDSFATNLEDVYTQTVSSYRMVFPIDLSPIKHGKIVATQSSGEPVEMAVSASYYSSVGTLYGSSEQIIGQNINVGLDYVQWKTLTLSNLDGSELTLSMTEADSIQTSTRESNELFSRGIGSLGMSEDEGFDAMDSWELNNSDFASYYSIELRETSDDLAASFSYYGNKMSVLSCGNQLNNDLFRKEGSGNYEIEVRKSFSGACPNDFQIAAPSTISPDSNFRIKFESNHVDEAYFELIDENFSTLLSTIFVVEDVWHPVSSIPELNTGSYFLIARNSDAVIVGERQIYVTNEPMLGVTKSESRLELNTNPKIHVTASNHHTNEPRNWEIDDMIISGFDNENQPFERSYGETLEGIGTTVITLDKIPDLLSGSQLIIAGSLSSDDTVQQFSLVWQVEFIQPTTTCESEFIYDSMNSHNQMLCMIALQSKIHGAGNMPMAEQAIDGELNIHNQTGKIVMSVPFTSDLFSPTPVRINVQDLGRYGNYSTTLSFADESTFFVENSASFVVSGLLGDEVDDEEQISDFDLTILSIRNTATQGDTVSILWEVSGQDVKYLVADIYVENEIVYSTTESVEKREGSLALKLPSSINPYNDHQITIRAVSEYGEIDTELAILQGLPEQSQLLVEIQPTKPTIGEDFSLNIVNPNGDNWISWEWQLSVSGSVISTDEGFAESDEVSISITLPVSQYTSNPVLEVWIETIDGTIENRVLGIDPLPMRSVEFVLKDDLVRDGVSEFEWNLQGIYLNKMDNVDLIEVRMYSMSFDLAHKQQYVSQGDKGQEEISLPSTILPGTYNLIVEFTFADGTSYEHIQTAQVLESPNGINFLGLTIPPLAMGLDTILVIGLVIHAIVLHRWMRGKELSKEEIDDEKFNQENDEDYDFIDFIDGAGVQPMVSTSDSNQHSDSDHETSDDLTSIDKSNPDLYQEYPVDSGHFWYRHSISEEWTMLSE